MATFKESYRLERVYFEKLKSMIDILKSFLDSETDEKTRAILTNEIDDNGAILLLYRNLGEAWSELADLIQKLRNDLTDLDEKEEAYHDELNERIDEVNNYLMALIRDLQARMDAVEADLAQMGRLFTYDLTQSGAVYTLTESGNAVTFADTVAKLTHVRPHFVAVRNGVNYYLIDTYDLTAATGSVTWSGWKFTAAGEIVQTVVTLNADNSVSVTETATNFAAILSRLTSVETRVTILEECCEDVEEVLEDIEEALDGKQDTLTAGNGIEIDPITNVITNTAMGTTYSGGVGIRISGSTIRKNFPLNDNEEFTLNSNVSVSNVSSTDITYVNNIYDFTVRSNTGDKQLAPNRNKIYRITLNHGNYIESISDNGLEMRLLIRPYVNIRSVATGATVYNRLPLIFCEEHRFYSYTEEGMRIYGGTMVPLLDYKTFVWTNYPTGGTLQLTPEVSVMAEVIKNDNNLSVQDIIQILTNIFQNYYTFTFSIYEKSV